jgi:IS605 OrfB family transposase
VVSVKLTIPAVMVNIGQQDELCLENLYRRFGIARRRAYMLKQRGVPKGEIERILQEELGLNSRYIKDAYHSIENLPPHVTFGGLKLQRLREEGKISREEFHKRRNSLIISRGDRTKKGNLNARVVRENSRLLLRINVSNGEEKRWIHPELFIPEKYLERYGHLLDGSRPYTVMIKRREDGGHNVKIIVEVPEEPRPETKRVMALDVNAGHVDFAVAGKERVLAVGRINCHEVQHASANKTSNLLHKTVNKIGNIADHYGAKVVYGKLNTAGFRGNRGANQRIKRIPHRRLGRILEYKCRAERRSEAYTTKVGREISRKAGLDVHKCSAAAFALKTLDYEAFRALCSSRIPRGVAPDEGDGSPRCRLSAGSGPTAPAQTNSLGGDEVAVCRNGGYPEIPGIRGLSFLESLKTGLPCLRVKIC